MIEWEQILRPGNKADGLARLGVALLFFSLNVYYGSNLKALYPTSMISLYMYPLWRLLMVLLLLSSTLWCPRVAVMVFFAIFFYFMDLQYLLEPVLKN
jgi:hypothetical protein